MDKQKTKVYLDLCKGLNDLIFSVTHNIDFDSLSQFDANRLFFQIGSLSALLSSRIMDLQSILDYEKNSSEI